VIIVNQEKDLLKEEKSRLEAENGTLRNGYNQLLNNQRPTNLPDN